MSEKLTEKTNEQETPIKGLSVHAPYVYDILTGEKTEEYRSWKPKTRGRILICSSAKHYAGYVSGYALCTVEIGEIRTDYDQYAWELKNLQYVRPFPVKGKLHLFDVNQSLIQPLEGISEEEFMEKYYEPLVK
ncbi:MAG: ASCH domain-containing protein [Eubacterium sp.]